MQSRRAVLLQFRSTGASCPGLSASIPSACLSNSPSLIGVQSLTAAFNSGWETRNGARSSTLFARRDRARPCHSLHCTSIRGAGHLTNLRTLSLSRTQRRLPFSVSARTTRTHGCVQAVRSIPNSRPRRPCRRCCRASSPRTAPDRRTAAGLRPHPPDN